MKEDVFALSSSKRGFRLDVPDFRRTAYDFASPLSGTMEANGSPTRGIELPTVGDLFIAYLQRNPGRRHLPTILLFLDAMSEALPCRRWCFSGEVCRNRASPA